MIILLYLTLGAAAGLIAGLFGVGGGLIIVPALLWAFTWQHFSVDHVTHLAIGTSLATIVITSLSSIRAHHQRGAVMWSVVWRMAPGIACGSAMGALTAASMSGAHLQFAFSLFVLLVAAQMGLGFAPAASRQLPGSIGLAVSGAVIGLVSSLFGIGGGSLTVPFLTWCNVVMKRAVAVSAACGLPIALVGSSAYIVQGHDIAALPSGSTGYVYWPAVAGIVLTSSPFASLGALLAHRLRAVLLKRIFALFMLVIGLKLLLTSSIVS